jgi:hypothetical protein
MYYAFIMQLPEFKVKPDASVAVYIRFLGCYAVLLVSCLDFLTHQDGNNRLS